jgi:Fur family transcriptional regulator, ferric uptake regulator
MATENNALRDVGLKVTKPRVHILQILEYFAMGGQHLSVEELYKHLCDMGEEIGLATVYRVLTQFENAGLVIRHRFEADHYVYELAKGGHHDHMVCIESGEVVEFTDSVIEKRQHQIAEEHGYELAKHSLVLYVRKKEA